MLRLDDMGNMVLSMGLSDFNEEYRRYCQNRLGADYAFAFVFPERSQPRIRVRSSESVNADNPVGRSFKAYFDGIYQRDEMISPRGTVDHPMRRAINARDSIDESQRDFFRIADITSSVSMSAKIGKSICYLGFLAVGGNVIPERKVEETFSLAGLLLPLVYRHDELLFLKEAEDVFLSGASDLQHVENRDANARQISSVLSASTTLSPREAEICAQVMLGYSIIASSLALGLSRATIETHRRRAFDKLGVTSGGELFGVYQQCLDRLERSVRRA